VKLDLLGAGQTWICRNVLSHLASLEVEVSAEKPGEAVRPKSYFASKKRRESDLVTRRYGSSFGASED
jgi:hypothetical protein